MNQKIIINKLDDYANCLSENIRRSGSLYAWYNNTRKIFEAVKSAMVF
jgi:hypothetical protein